MLNEICNIDMMCWFYYVLWPVERTLSTVLANLFFETKQIKAFFALIKMLFKPHNELFLLLINLVQHRRCRSCRITSNMRSSAMPIMNCLAKSVGRKCHFVEIHEHQVLLRVRYLLISSVKL